MSVFLGAKITPMNRKPMPIPNQIMSNASGFAGFDTK